jgi:hypothetical protein
VTKTGPFDSSAARLTLLGATALGLLVFAAGSSALPTALFPEPFWLSWVKTMVTGLGAIGTVSVGMVLPLLFIVWNPRLLSGAAHVPIRSLALLGAVALLSCAYMVTFWSSGLGFPGLAYLQMMVALNVAILAVIVVLAVVATRRPGFRWNLAFHWLLFAWVGSYAFAWLTE